MVDYEQIARDILNSIPRAEDTNADLRKLMGFMSDGTHLVYPVSEEFIDQCKKTEGVNGEGAISVTIKP